MQTGVNSSCSPSRIPNKYQVKILTPHKSPCFIIFLGICESFPTFAAFFPHLSGVRCQQLCQPPQGRTGEKSVLKTTADVVMVVFMV